MNYEKKYKEALERAKRWADGTLMPPDDSPETVAVAIFPELAESEDERIRRKMIEHFKSKTKETWCNMPVKGIIAYLEKQKEQKPRLVGEDSFEKMARLMYETGQTIEEQKPWKIGENAYFTPEQKPTEPFDDELLRHEDELYDFKVFAAEQAKEHHISFVHDFEWNNFCEELLSYFNEKQKPAEGIEYSCPDCGTTSGCTNDESEGDKRYREGIRYALKQTEDYTIGKTFKGLIPCWVNAPSELQPAHKYHGKNVVIMHENNGGFRCVCIDDEKPVTFHLPEDTLFAEGWRKKPAEWSEEDEKMKERLITRLNWITYNTRTDGTSPNITFFDEINWLKSLLPPQYCENCRLKKSVQGWKPSEKEIAAFENMLKGEFPDGIFPGVTLSELLAKLKKLYYNESIPSWKPSDEQMSAVKHAYDSFPNYCSTKLGLKTLYEDLKKLM